MAAFLVKIVFFGLRQAVGHPPHYFKDAGCKKACCMDTQIAQTQFTAWQLLKRVFFFMLQVLGILDVIKSYVSWGCMQGPVNCQLPVSYLLHSCWWLTLLLGILIQSRSSKRTMPCGGGWGHPEVESKCDNTTSVPD